MNISVKQYLREKQEEFFPEEPSSVSAKESTEEQDLAFMKNQYTTGKIKVKEVPNNSDPILNADEFMYSNSKIHSAYARGKGFKINDTQDSYEVVKLIKDLTDKHLFLNDMTWKADTTGKKTIINFVVGRGEAAETNKFFLNGAQQHLLLNLHKKFGNLYKMTSEVLKDVLGGMILQIVIEKDKDEERKVVQMVQAINPKIDSINPQPSSITSI